MNLLTKQNETDRLVPRGKDSYGVWDGHVHTAIFKTDNQCGPII